MISYFKYASGEAFTLDGDDYAGFFNIENKKAYTGKLRTASSQLLSAKNTFLANSFLGEKEFDRTAAPVIESEELTQPVVSPKNVIDQTFLNKNLSILNNNNLNLYCLNVISNTDLISFGNSTTDGTSYFLGISSEGGGRGEEDTVLYKDNSFPLQINPFSLADNVGAGINQLDKTIDSSLVVNTDRSFYYFVITNSNSFSFSGSFVKNGSLVLLKTGEFAPSSTFTFDNNTNTLYNVIKVGETVPSPPQIPDQPPGEVHFGPRGAQAVQYYVNRPQARTLMGPQSLYQGRLLEFYETGGVVEQLPGEIIGVLRGSNAPYITESGERIGVFVKLPLIGAGVFTPDLNPLIASGKFRPVSNSPSLIYEVSSGDRFYRPRYPNISESSINVFRAAPTLTALQRSVQIPTVETGGHSTPNTDLISVREGETGRVDIYHINAYDMSFYATCQTFKLKDKIIVKKNIINGEIKLGNNLKGFLFQSASNNKVSIELSNKYSNDFYGLITTELESEEIVSFDIRDTDDSILIITQPATQQTFFNLYHLDGEHIRNLNMNTQDPGKIIRYKPNTYKYNIQANHPTKIRFATNDSNVFYLTDDGFLTSGFISNPTSPSGLGSRNNLLYPTDAIWAQSEEIFDDIQLKWNTNQLKSNYFNHINYLHAENDFDVFTLLHNVGRIYLSSSKKLLYNNLVPLDLINGYEKLTTCESGLGISINSEIQSILKDTINLFLNLSTIPVRKLVEGMPVLAGYTSTQRINVNFRDFEFHENEEVNYNTVSRVFNKLYTLQKTILDSILNM